MRRSCVYLLFSVLTVGQLLAQDASPTANQTSNPATDPQKAEVIRQILAASGTDRLVRQMMDANMSQSTSMLPQNSTLPPAFLDALQSRVAARLKSLDWAEFVIPVYSKNFTLEELRQLLAFQQSSVGQKVSRLQPTMYSEIAG